MRKLLLLAGLFLAFHTAPAVANGKQETSCGGPETPCVLESGRSYHLRIPDGWDGVSPLPVMLYFHGWKRQGAQPAKSSRVGAATAKRGVLLVAPNGQNRTWNFWSADTEDVGFAQDVLADAARRFPIDRDRIFVSGYSFGSAMAWRYACQKGGHVAALLAVAGSLRRVTACPQAPGEVRHVHGLKDTVMDFPMGPGGDTTHPVAFWRKTFGCGEGGRPGEWTPADETGLLTFERISWEDCPGGTVHLDLHPRGHFIPRGWIARQLDEILGLEPSFP